MDEKTGLPTILSALRKEMPRLEETYQVKNLGVFGPYAAGKQQTRTVLELLVEYDRTPGLFKFVELERHLGETLGMKVKLVSKGGLRGKDSDRVLDKLAWV